MKLSVNMSTDHASTERAIYGHFDLFWGFGGHFGPVLEGLKSLLGLFWGGGYGGHFGPVMGGSEAILALFMGFGGHVFCF